MITNYKAGIHGKKYDISFKTEDKDLYFNIRKILDDAIQKEMGLASAEEIEEAGKESD